MAANQNSFVLNLICQESINKKYIDGAELVDIMNAFYIQQGQVSYQKVSNISASNCVECFITVSKSAFLIAVMKKKGTKSCVHSCKLKADFKTRELKDVFIIVN